MIWFNNLKLNAKINLILLSLLICLFVLAGFLTYRDQQTLLQTVALQHARDIARQITETRNYMVDAVNNEAESNYALVPQVVATGVARRLTAGSHYYVRQVSLRYRNPENRPDDYETVQLKSLSASGEQESHQITEIDGKKTFRYMLEMNAEKSCLECHGAYDDAPRFVQERFPPGHFSYDYRVGEVIGAISISIPMAELNNNFSTSLEHEVLLRISILVLVFIVMAFLIKRFIISPIQLASSAMSRVAETGDLSERIPGKISKDEIGELIGSFNEMMEELDRTTLQRNESETRYRNLIEAARTAIVTFLGDGRILISNQLAEKLFGMPRNDLLGKSLFDFLEITSTLRQHIADLTGSDNAQSLKTTERNRIRSFNGKWTEIEITLIPASSTDSAPMFTVLLREIGR